MLYYVAEMNERFDIVAFGEILWDVIDGVPHLGGAPFNFAARAGAIPDDL